MMWPELLCIVLDRDRVAELNVAQSEGLILDGAAQGVPMLQVRDGAVLQGGLLDLASREEFARLDFFTCVFGGTPVPKHISVAGQQIAAVAFLSDAPPAAGAHWSMTFENWVATHGAVMLEAAREVMGYFRRIPATDFIWRRQMILARAAARVAARTLPAPATQRSMRKASEVAIHDCAAPHEGFFLTRTYQLQHPQFDGSVSAPLQREVFVATDAVIVLPYDPLRDRVLLVEQFRMGPFGRGDPLPWVLEPVAGRVDAGERPEDAARRECHEEAGLTLQHLEHVSSHYCSPGCSTEFYHCYVALVDLPDETARLGGLATEQEDIQTHIVDFDRAMGLIESGEANIGPLVLLLLWLQRERTRLKSRCI